MLSKNTVSQQQVNSTSGNLFSLEDISVSFGNIPALRNVDMSVKSGEILFLTGVSGAGKTTLLKLLAGEIKADAGRFKSICDINPNFFIARVFQDSRFVEEISCLENLEIVYNPEVYSSYKEFQSDLKDLTRILGVGDRINLKMKNSNGGLRQKIALIRALLTRPNILLADEPTNSLDLENSRKIFDILNLYNVKRGLTVVWSTHNRDLVKKFTGRILHLDRGKLIYSGHACFI